MGCMMVCNILTAYHESKYLGWSGFLFWSVLPGHMVTEGFFCFCFFFLVIMKG